MEKGYLSIVLHAHLPYVRHPEHERFLEEEWFYEAVTETYIPLVKVFHSLVRDGVDFRLTLSLTPTLLSMLTDPLLQSRYVKHLDRLIELSQKEMERTRPDSAFSPLAEMYHRLFLEAREIFCDRYHNDLAGAFREFQEMGKLEIITCAATHGFLPLLDIHKEAVRAQIRVGVETHKRILGRAPKGIWLPECGYTPGVDEILKENGILFFIMDTHGVLFGSPRPKYGIYAPVYCKSGVAAFGRDPESSKSVWSAEEGYPGDANYREFYRDIGFDLDYDYVRPYLNGDGSRINTGIKYYRITGKTDHKEPYSPHWAREKAAEHAGNFMFNREKQVEYLSGFMDRPPLVVAPYDAELFGHWWFEGPMWFDFLFRKIHYDQNVFKAISLAEYLEKYPCNQKIVPSMSSWGYNGYAEVWLNGANDWIYRHLHKAAERMIDLANQRPHAGGLEARALNQMARELLLAQSSDWAFILKTGTHSAYALKRTKEHLERFMRLWSQLKENSVDTRALESIESTDNIFPDIDYRVYLSKQ
ncbi:MAG: glycoside hydrolase [Omnitrophica bacterium RIFCSPHIGHO2_02_FULL_51_18]|nr:MAG: glycoside hydrolase [Omnitrophica bacterium RIFCSPHIGHO2_02_FULL_51_18]